jgi:hypothetical protein
VAISVSLRWCPGIARNRSLGSLPTKEKIVLKILLAILISSSAVAEEISFEHPEKQAIFDQIETINQTWAIDRNCDGLREYFHEDYILMFQGGGRGNGIDEAIEGYKAFIATATDITWKIVDPVINIYCDGKCAVVSIEYFMEWNENDNKVDSHGKNLIFFLKENDQWLMTAEHFSEIPPTK